MASLLAFRNLFLRPAPVFIPLVARPLSTTAFRRHGESQSNDPDFEVEKLKKDSLQRQKKGQGEWMAGLASDSEEDIKADKSGFTAKEAVERSKQSYDAKTGKKTN
ncbi:hypothetical protein SEUCBS139899_001081 [Sporothrix eucalyptigena]|uniref:Mitochondrial carrier protein n=1 Tax=Sporothrix eucalyptigena TaxID=1812306 RepID=A0ABP0B5T7_9PEZI